MTSTTSFPPLLVVAAVVLRDGRVLLTKRRAGTHLGGSWEFPGGKVEPGETPRGALERELEEELGVVANVGEAFAFNDHTYSDRHVLLLTYLTGIRGEPSPVGCDEVRWCDAAEVTRLTMPPADRPIIERLIPLLSGGSVG